MHSKFGKDTWKPFKFSCPQANGNTCCNARMGTSFMMAWPGSPCDVIMLLFNYTGQTLGTSFMVAWLVTPCNVIMLLFPQVRRWVRPSWWLDRDLRVTSLCYYLIIQVKCWVRPSWWLDRGHLVTSLCYYFHRSDAGYGLHGGMPRDRIRLWLSDQDDSSSWGYVIHDRVGHRDQTRKYRRHQHTHRGIWELAACD